MKKTLPVLVIIGVIAYYAYTYYEGKLTDQDWRIRQMGNQMNQNMNNMIHQQNANIDQFNRQHQFTTWWR